MKIYMYILGASKSPDQISCPVPKEVNDRIVFFGPCKKRLRDHFYGDYLSENDSGEVLATRSIYLIGINASNARKPRKIVWAGKVKKFLTFERAYKIYSKSKRFQKVMNATESPIHIKPMYKDGHFIGYHNEKSWKEECFHSVGRGQEFVIEENRDVGRYFKNLIERNSIS
jgi:hypothetical protein